jgi:hypothetical protein
VSRVCVRGHDGNGDAARGCGEVEDVEEGVAAVDGAGREVDVGFTGGVDLLLGGCKVGGKSEGGGG